MKVTFKNWLKLFWDQNYRYYLILLCGFCIVLPLFTCSFFSDSFFFDRGYSFRLNALFFNSIFTVCIAVYLFRFLYRKEAAVLVFGMPENRRRLFRYRWLTGYLAVVTEIVLQMVCYALLYRISFSAYLTNIFADLQWLLSPVLFQSIVYAITVYFICECRRMLDAVIIGGGWLFALYLLQISLLSFLNMRAAYFIEASSYSFVIPQAIYSLLTFLSLPHFGSYLLQWSHYGSFLLFPLLWWGSLAVLAYRSAQRRFYRLRVEECGTTTRSYAVYPFLILLFCASLLNLLQWNEWTPFLIAGIFLLYAGLYFLYKRRVLFSLHMLIGFIGMLAAELAVSAVFVWTSGFGLIHETMTKDFQQLEVTVMLDTITQDAESERLLARVLDKYKVELHENDIVYQLSVTTTPKSDTLQPLIALQKRLMQLPKTELYSSLITYTYDRPNLPQTYTYASENNHITNECLKELLRILLEPENDAKVGFQIQQY